MLVDVRKPNSHFFFNDTATTEIYTLSLHDALPISVHAKAGLSRSESDPPVMEFADTAAHLRSLFASGRPVIGICAADRKSTRLNSSHANISYAVFCLKK